MATAAQIASLKLRQPNLPPAATDAVIGQFIDDAALEMVDVGISTTHTKYDKLLSLMALHLMTVSNIVKDPTSESVDKISASYNKKQNKGGSIYEDEFNKIVRREFYPPFLLHNS